MAGVYNRGKFELLSGGAALLSSPVRAMLVKTTYTFSPGHNTVADIVASELSGPGYSRKDLTNKVVRQNDAQNRAEFDADDLQWTDLNTEAAKGVVLFIPGATDGSSDLLFFIDGGGFPVSLNNVNLTIQWDATGIVHLA